MTEQRSDRLIESLRTVSWSILMLIAVVLVVSVYIIQRSLIGAMSVRDAYFVSIMSHALPQVMIGGLAFSYRTLTLLWPIILGTASLCFTFMVQKQLYIWKYVQQSDPSLSPEVAFALDPWLLALTPSVIRGGKFFWGLLSVVPCVAIVCHFAVTSVMIIAEARTPSLGVGFSVKVMVGSLVLLISSVYGAIGAVCLVFAIRKMKSTFEWSDKPIKDS